MPSEMDVAALRFLVVEDHEFQRHGMLAVLRGLGATHVDEACDGHAALQMFRRPGPQFDIVISDLDMPGMDGMEFIRKLGHSGSAVSIVLASALAPQLLESIETMAAAYGINLLGIIRKPVTPQGLQVFVDAHLAKTIVVREPGPVARTYAIGEIARALSLGQFEPFFQPKVDLHTGRVVGAEALARWRHPEHGIVDPRAFIQPMEDHGLIDALTWTMLEQSALACRRWRAGGLDITVSVNLSIKSLGDVDQAHRIAELVAAVGLEPRHMVFEVTESATANNHLGSTLENLSRLRMKGFGLSIDDYGTGYSSMQQLARIAFTELKIDQSLVRAARLQASSRILLESSVDTARKLKIDAVAEGVETRDEWHLMRSLGCHQAQGYFIARPMAQECLADFVDGWRNRSDLA